MNLVYVYLVAHAVLHWVGLVYIIFEILFFALRCKLLFDFKTFTGCVEWASRHPPKKYLGIWMILEFLHKLAYNYSYT